MDGTASHEGGLLVSRDIPMWAGVASSSKGQPSPCQSPEEFQTTLLIIHIPVTLVVIGFPFLVPKSSYIINPELQQL